MAAEADRKDQRAEDDPQTQDGDVPGYPGNDRSFLQDLPPAQVDDEAVRENEDAAAADPDAG